MDDFEALLNAERIPVERYVRFRLNSRPDATASPAISFEKNEAGVFPCLVS